MSQAATFKDDEVFQAACELVKIKPTSRQFNKWKRNTGAAYVVRQKAQAVVRNKMKKEGRWKNGPSCS